MAPVVAAGASAKHLDGKTSAPIVCATPCLRYALSRAPAHRLVIDQNLHTDSFF